MPREHDGGSTTARWRDLRRQSPAGAGIRIPLSWIYGFGVAVARRLRRTRASPPAGARVVGIGNLEVGGNGKTPLAMLLLERALARGARCAYVSRGFGSRAGRLGVITIVESADTPSPVTGAGSRVVSRRHPDLAAEIGDEAALVAERIPGVSLFLSRDKRRAVELAARAGAGVIVVDDAFQTWRLARHLDVVLLDADEPVANRRLLPAGPLRESPRALGRADVVVFNGAQSAEAVPRAAERVRAWLRPDTRVAGLARSIRLVPVRGGATEGPARAVLVSAIARPGSFARDVEALGVEVVEHLAWPDHHFYRDAEVSTIARFCAGRACDAVVTTEKDWVKLRGFEFPELRIWTACLDVSWVGDDPLT